MVEQGHYILYYKGVEGEYSASSVNDQTAFNTTLKTIIYVLN